LLVVSVSLDGQWTENPMLRPSLAKFRRTFDSSFWSKVTTESLVPIPKAERPIRANLLPTLHNDILTTRYMPNIPRAYLTENKGGGVARVIPIFTIIDYCAYYYCVKSLEKPLTLHRVSGTFGGFQMSNPAKGSEQEELEKALAGYDPGSGVPPGALNPLGWRQEWLRFQALAATRAQAIPSCVAVTFDIANFYDSINLPTLELSLWQATNVDYSFEIHLLMCILSNWNRGLDLYKPKQQGVPQDEVGDMSRLLANFYLQGCDKRMSAEAQRLGCEVLRFSDDHLILAPSLAVANEMLYVACIELHRIGLNVNASKVRPFATWNEYRQSRGLNILEYLPDHAEDDHVNIAASMFQSQIETRLYFREDSVSKRFLSIGLDRLEPDAREFIGSRLLERSSLRHANLWWLRKLYASLSREERSQMLSSLDQEVSETSFTSFLYSVARFYEKTVGLDAAQIDHVHQRIALAEKRLNG